MVRTLRGLEDSIAVKYVRPSANDHLQRNWVVSHEIPDDSLASLKSDDGEFQTVKAIYQNENNSSNTIPLLYDQEHQCIVNNNAEDITFMFNSAFPYLAKNATTMEKFSTTTSTESDLNEWLFPLLQLTPSSTPPYHYNLSPRQLDHAFQKATTILQKQRYLTSHTTLSTADLRLFAALIRYDAVYAQYLSFGSMPLVLLHNRVLMDFCRDIYQQPGVAETVHMEDIRMHFLGTKSGSDKGLLEMLDMPHKRTMM